MTPGPDAVALSVLTPDRARAVLRWKDAGLSPATISELGSSWHLPDDTSPWFGVPGFGLALMARAAEMVRDEP